ncbi:uncharacterized protein BT62DRAFT_1079743 [Guyanagaster necrorhizus]|uniref:Uncharacterized protein n=1 Tax=Guyanagaster necrorhizus TaxID=856835 RepID=A0A9P8AN01_9AGAR|nr:uncharacterized protein BT62DRAFT_1079743 [Guyanagaster necrorhizus MCA 3950]KAG7441783.1 hypothetical protein BT62DRAFT_1079743 [Guyanagaster necrorhizus MCA 3950]
MSETQEYLLSLGIIQHVRMTVVKISLEPDFITEVENAFSIWAVLITRSSMTMGIELVLVEDRESTLLFVIMDEAYTFSLKEDDATITADDLNDGMNHMPNIHLQSSITSTRRRIPAQCVYTRTTHSIDEQLEETGTGRLSEFILASAMETIASQDIDVLKHRGNAGVHEPESLPPSFSLNRLGSAALATNIFIDFAMDQNRGKRMMEMTVCDLPILPVRPFNEQQSSLQGTFFHTEIGRCVHAVNTIKDGENVKERPVCLISKEIRQRFGGGGVRSGNDSYRGVPDEVVHVDCEEGGSYELGMLTSEEVMEPPRKLVEECKKTRILVSDVGETKYI